MNANDQNLDVSFDGRTLPKVHMQDNVRKQIC